MPNQQPLPKKKVVPNPVTPDVPVYDPMTEFLPWAKEVDFLEDFVSADEYFDNYHAYIFKNNIKPDDKDPYSITYRTSISKKVWDSKNPKWIFTAGGFDQKSVSK